MEDQEDAGPLDKQIKDVHIRGRQLQLVKNPFRDVSEGSFIAPCGRPIVISVQGIVAFGVRDEIHEWLLEMNMPYRLYPLASMPIRGASRPPDPWILSFEHHSHATLFKLRWGGV